MKLAIGTVQFGMNYGIANQHGQVSLDEARAILNCGSMHGIDTLDTAIAYDESEQRLGEIGVENWRVISKLPAVPHDCREMSRWVVNAVKTSLKRMKIRHFYGLLLHYPQQLLGQEGDLLYKTLCRIKLDGLVQKIGVSIYSPSELDILCSRFKFDLVQAPFNVLDQRLIDTGWLSRLAEQNTELHVRSVFLQGLLLMQPGDRPNKFKPFFSILDRWDRWRKETGLTAVQACVRYAISFQQISKVIIGVDTPEQLSEILHAAEGQKLEIPVELCCLDDKLINPSNWSKL